VESPAFEGRTFGAVGTYDKIIARATIGVAPDNPHNAIIVDVDRAPRDPQGLIEANPERIVWGTDWPHPNSIPAKPITEVTPLFQIADGHLLNQLPVWAQDAAVRTKILVDNPARLYGFA